MDAESTSSQGRRAMAARSRANAFYCAIGAVILIYCAYFQGTWIYDWSSWYGKGVWLIMVAMKAGGILLAVDAIFCLIGWSAALLLDAVTMTAIGVTLTLGSLLSFQSGSTSTFLYLVLGLFLAHSGYRSWQEYRSWVPMLARARGAPPRGADSQTSVAIPMTPGEITPPASLDASALPPDPLQPGSAVPAPPPEGFLAAFGEDQDSSQSPKGSP